MSEDGESFKKENNLHLFLETSAKTGFNSKNVFIEAAKVLYKDYLLYKDTISRRSSIDSNITKNNNIKLPKSLSENEENIIENDKKKKKKCC